MGIKWGNTETRAQEATSARGSKVYEDTVVEESAASESLNRRREWGLSSFVLVRLCNSLSVNIFQVNGNQAL